MTSDLLPPPRVAVVVGNPKAGSRTLAAAEFLAEQLTGATPTLSIDLTEYGAALLDWQDLAVADLVDQVRGVDIAVFASPTYKATFTGLLKIFLDRFPYQGLRGVIAVPLMLGALPGHALAPELGLRPVLVEIGASVPARGLYVVESSYQDPRAYEEWLAVSRDPIHALLRSAASAAPSALRTEVSR